MIYDSIIIGAGLIGSAAAKYISEAERNVALIGPDEEKVLSEKIVFASHYDSSRVQRTFGTDAVSTLLNLESAEQYDSIEKATGIHFHSKDGCLYVNPSGTDAYLNNINELAKTFDIKYQRFASGESLKSFAPDFNFTETANGIFESSPSGHINPRKLIKAQQILFQKNGGAIFNDTVKSVNRENGILEIETLDGKRYHSNKVLLSPGAFINSFDLLKRKLLLRIKSETTIWAKVSADTASRLSKMPALLYNISEPDIQEIYLVRPVEYPDGNFYLKMGANFPGDINFNNLNEIQDWFKDENGGGNLKIAEAALMHLIPNLLIEACYEKKCIVCYTQHGKPYIGEVDDKIFVAAGGNGYSAMSSDALGKIAAALLLKNNFPIEYLSENFAPVFC
ncbi:MAG: FAD-binding oxidoreductase [Ginsengibacter sp.]